MIAEGDLSALGYDSISDPLFPKTDAGAVPPMILPTSRKQFFFQTNVGKEWGAFGIDSGVRLKSSSHK